MPDFTASPRSSKPITVTIKPLVLQKRFNNQLPDKVDAYSKENNTTANSTKGRKGKDGTATPRKGKLTSLKELSVAGMGEIPAEVLSAAKEAQGEAAYEGDDLQTQLNTKEHVYYSYFARIKVRLDNVWQLTVRDKLKELYDRRIISLAEDKLTRVIITLTNQGRLHKVQIILPSGVQDLDSTAVDAFRQAEPFPNPPTGLIDPDGFIRITWSFIVDFH